MKQRNIPRLGALIDSLYTSLPFLSIINFLSIITVLYATIHEYLFQWFPWLTFWVFVGIMTGIVVITMILTYKFILPSIWTFRGKQMFGYESQVADVLKEINKRLKKLEEIKETREGEEKNNG